MADRYLRTTFRNWVSTYSVPFYDTVNREVSPADTMWLTVDWGLPYRTKESYCNEFVEEGTISIVFFGPAGDGDDALLSQTEPIIADLMTKVDTSGRLVLLDASSPIDFREHENFCVEYQINYEYRV